jgi:hypothetical protein
LGAVSRKISENRWVQKIEKIKPWGQVGLLLPWRCLAIESELCAGKNKMKIFKDNSNCKNMVFNVEKL